MTAPEPADWPALIGTMIIVKQQIDEADRQHLAEYTVPRVKASQDEILAFERAVGERLPNDYRNFLLHANGWPAFFFLVNLFGLPELQGEGDAETGAALLRSYDEEGVLADLGLTVDDVIVVGAGAGSRDLFLLIREGRPGAGQVSWLDGEEIDRYQDFPEFFASLIEYHRLRLQKLAQAN
jgi:SMI1/KNR4 family protein SUKH-1